MASKLSISDLADVLAALKEVTKSYQLGIQLKIDSSELDSIEKNHPRDVDQQKTEVIKYWLCNSPDASWTTLANAVERMGRHANIVQRLRGGVEVEIRREELSSIRSQQHSACIPVMTEMDIAICLTTCEDSNILLLGKMSNGKSTLGNKMLNCDCSFKINSRECPQTCKDSAILFSTSQCKSYMINVYDHDGLFEGASSINAISSEIPESLNLVIFVLKHGHNFDANEREILKTLVSQWQISQISALALTHCERLSDEERGEMIEQFKKEHPQVAALMGKGFCTVGFPDNSHIQPGSELSQVVENDKKKLKRLIYSCDDRVIIPNHPQIETISQDSNSDEQWTIDQANFRLLQRPNRNEIAQGHQRLIRNGQLGCCSIL